MNWYKYCVISIVAFFLVSPIMAMDVVVVESNYPLMPPGHVIHGDTEIDLKEGVFVKVLGANGSISILNGVYSGPVITHKNGEENIGLIDVVKNLVTESQKKSSTLGAVRSSTTEGDLGLWEIPIYQSGIYCVLSNSRPTLVRKKSESTITLSLKKRGGNKVKISWPKGRSKNDWPLKLELVNGGTYSAKSSGQPLPVKLKIYVIESEHNEVAAIPLLVDKKCTSQARRLLVRLMVP